MSLMAAFIFILGDVIIGEGGGSGGSWLTLDSLSLTLDGDLLY